MKKLVVGNARLLSDAIDDEIDEVYTVDIWVGDQEYSLLVAGHTAGNGIRCITGHQLLAELSFYPNQNTYREVGDAIVRCRSDRDS